MDDSNYVTIRVPRPNRRWLQIGLKAFLICSLLAGVILGYYGRWWRTHAVETYVQTYDVADLVVPKAPTAYVASDFELLIQQINERVAPDSWTGNGGPGAIRAFPTNVTLVVTQSSDVHKELAQFLNEGQASK